MRALIRDFSASTQDHTARHLELRLLPQPLYRYESTDPDVLDGAVFAFVSSTDPEALLVIEARKPAPADGPVWNYAICRFTDLSLSVQHKGKEVFTAPLIAYKFARARSQATATACSTTGTFLRLKRRNLREPGESSRQTFKTRTAPRCR